jgi:hypothetical protein
VQEDFLVLERTPDALDEHVVDAAALAVHADGDGGAAQRASEGIRGELRALVGVENPGAGSRCSRTFVVTSRQKGSRCSSSRASRPAAYAR